jgi:hypothetical protein
VIDLDEIKNRINPAYADRRGSESHERKTLCDEIERLQAALQHEKDVAEAYKAEADEIERLREHIATQKAYYESVFEDGARRIAKLTEQRDMAVESLIATDEADTPTKQLDAFDLRKEVLTAIKASEVTK